MQERKQGGEDERVVAKSKTARNLVSKTSQSVYNCAEFELISNPGEHTAKSSIWDSFGTGKPVAMDSNEDNAPGSQVWHADANPNSSTGILVARSKKSSVGTRLSFTIWTYHQPTSSTLWMPTNTYDVNLVALRTDKMERININATIWGSFMNASMKAAVHVGTDYEAIVPVARTPEFSEIRPSFPPHAERGRWSTEWNIWNIHDWLG